jgi:hypothetical protein
VIALLTLFACLSDAEFVTMTGTVFSGSGEDATPVGGAEIHSLAVTNLEVDRVFADDSGAFSIQIPSGASFFVGAEANGYVPTGFSGQSATSDYSVTDGLLYMHSQASYDGIQADFDGCASNDEGGPTLEGWVAFGIDNGDVIETYLVTTAWVTAYSGDGDPYDTCYLDDLEESAVYDPDATLTGSHGRFLVQGAPTGLMTLETAYWIDQASDWQTDPLYYIVYAPPGGIASFQPLWVPVLQ